MRNLEISSAAASLPCCLILPPFVVEAPHYLAAIWLERFVLARVLFFAGWLSAVYCLAWLSYNFFESRFTALKRYFPYHVE